VQVSSRRMKTFPRREFPYRRSIQYQGRHALPDCIEIHRFPSLVDLHTGIDYISSDIQSRLKSPSPCRAYLQEVSLVTFTFEVHRRESSCEDLKAPSVSSIFLNLTEESRRRETDSHEKTPGNHCLKGEQLRNTLQQRLVSNPIMFVDTESPELRLR
jgi:hypothetical protein